MMGEITEAQADALEKAWDLLREHFDCVVVTFDTEATSGTDRLFHGYFHGGITNALGLCKRMENRLIKASDDSFAEGEEP